MSGSPQTVVIAKYRAADMKFRIIDANINGDRHSKSIKTGIRVLRKQAFDHTHAN